MTESLWEEQDLPAKKQHRPRKAAQPMSAVIPVSETSQPKPPAFQPRAEVRDWSMEEAIRNCAPILHPDEIAAHLSIIRPGLT